MTRINAKKSSARVGADSHKLDVIIVFEDGEFGITLSDDGHSGYDETILLASDANREIAIRKAIRNVDRISHALEKFV